MKTLRDLLIHELKDLYHAEKQLLKALPKVAKAASSVELKDAITAHLDETKGHVERLEKAFELLDLAARGTKCDAMEGLIAEADELIKEESDTDPAVMDAALIASAQRIEHYEIAGYGCARAFAEQIGESEIVKLLTMTLDEEGEANKTLTQIAVETVNAEAMKAEATGSK